MAQWFTLLATLNLPSSSLLFLLLLQLKHSQHFVQVKFNFTSFIWTLFLNIILNSNRHFKGHGYGINYQVNPDLTYQRERGYSYIQAYGREFCKPGKICRPPDPNFFQGKLFNNGQLYYGPITTDPQVRQWIYLWLFLIFFYSKSYFSSSIIIIFFRLLQGSKLSKTSQM